jgi:glycosyltransferase involved in cell wall biosynthesis
MTANGGGRTQQPTPDEVLAGPVPQYSTLTIVIPVFNECETLLPLLRTVCAQPTPPLRKQIIIVDDASTDGTRELLRGDWQHGLPLDPSDSLTLLVHAENRGKGACVQTALASATGELVLIQDADLEYDPADYPELLKPVLEGHADAVYGSRFHLGSQRVPRTGRYLLNRCFSLLCNAITGIRLRDVTCCYKLLRRDLMTALDLKSPRFGMETEMTVKLAATRARIYEVPVRYHGRTYSEGKKINWSDGVAAVWHLLRYRLIH